MLFATTVEENLKLGNENLTEDAMVNACVMANAHDFILKLPKVTFCEFQPLGVCSTLASHKTILLSCLDSRVCRKALRVQ